MRYNMIHLYFRWLFPLKETNGTLLQYRSDEFEQQVSEQLKSRRWC